MATNSHSQALVRQEKIRPLELTIFYMQTISKQLDTQSWKIDTTITCILVIIDLSWQLSASDQYFLLYSICELGSMICTCTFVASLSCVVKCGVILDVIHQAC